MTRSRLRNLLLGLFSAACLGFTGLVGYTLLFVPDFYETPIGGPFALQDIDGATVTDSDLAGAYPLIYFGYTYCPDICPTALTEMTRALEQLEDTAADKAGRVVPVFITVDPARDTAETLAQYRTHFHPRLLALTGPDERIAEAAAAYQVFYQPIESESGGDYLMDHTSYIYLMGPDGGYLTHFGKDADAGRIAEALAQRIE